MRFAMFVCPRPGFEPDEALGAETEAWVSAVDASGARLIGDIFAPAREATVIGEGPRQATDEIAGFDVLDCADLEEAKSIVSRHPMSRHGSIILRAFWEG